MGGVLTGDFGRSALTNSTVTSQLGEKLTITAPLILASSAVALAAAIPLGVYAAVRHRQADGVGLSAIGQLGIAIPQFLAGIALIALFAGMWGLPSQGFPRNGWDDPARAMKSLILPVLTLAAAQGAILLRFVRASTLDVLNQDYIRTARAKGLSRTEALMVHGLRNAAIPVVSVLGIQIASLIAGVVVIEEVFNLPGVGQMLVRDVGNRDFDKVQGTILLIAVIVLVIGFLVDLAHYLIDPRLRTAER
jgi:peptide/nickel transport system permease protein